MDSTGVGPLARLARRILIAGMVVVAGILGYMLIDLPNRLEGPASFVFFYLMPALVLGGLVLLVRASPEVWISSALLLVFTLVPLYAIESVVEWRTQLRTFEGMDPDSVYGACPGRWADNALCFAAALEGGDFDTRTRLAVIGDYESEGRPAWPNVYASLIDESRYLELDGTPVRPLGGISDVWTVFCNESGTWHAYQADEHGFNNPAGSHGGDAQILLLGDSFTQGRCVSGAETFQSRIRSVYPGTVSLGLDGSGPLHELAALREFGAQLRPSLVLWMFFEGNDLLDLDEERTDPILSQYLDPGYSQGLVILQDRIDGALKERIVALRIEEENRSERLSHRRMEDHRDRYTMTPWSLASLRRIRRAAFTLLEGRRVDPDPEYPGQLLRSVLLRAQADVASWGGRLAFVYLPEWNRFGRPDIAFPHRERVLADVHDLGLPLIDLVPVFEGHSDWRSLFPYGLSAHYNGVGYGVAAEHLLREIDALLADGPGGA